MHVRLESLEQTGALAQAIAPRLAAGALVLVDGQFGAGKTAFARCLVAALGGDANAVASPTYTLLNRYHAHLPVYHVDAYRLRSADELRALGFDELREDGVAIVEWAERIELAFDRRDAWNLRLSHAGGGRVAEVAMPEDQAALPLHWPASR